MILHPYLLGNSGHDMDGLEDARVGYPCLYPACRERRKYHIQLVEHVETDHTSREVLERMVIRDKSGNILALPPHCIFRYFPDVGLSPDKVHEIMESLTAKDRSQDPLLSSANPIHPQTLSTPSTPLSSTPGSFSDLSMANPNPGIYLANPHLNPVPSLSRPSIPSNITLNDLLTNTASGDNRGNIMTLLALRQRMLQQQQLQQQQQGLMGSQPQQAENQEPNIVVAGLRQLLSAPHTPLLQQLVQTAGRGEKSSHSLPFPLAGQKVEPLPCISPAPSACMSLASCATPPAPSPDSGRGSESSMEESIDQNASLTQGSCSGSSLQSTADDNSNDSWTQRQDYSVEAIVSFSRNGVAKRPKSASDSDKPYACPVPGCVKSYKNMNGIKYHARCAHRIRKAHRCTCNKKYASEDKYLAHIVKCQKSRKDAAMAAQTAMASSHCNGVGASPPSSQPAQMSCASASTSATTTPTLHQLLKTASPTGGRATTTSPTLPSLPSVFGAGARSGNTSLLHSLLDG